ncbi:MAG: translation initiation factor IF-3 [Patescibacteria group bacterium]
MGKFYRINQYIQAKEVRVVDETGKQIGVMPIFNAIQAAREAGKDLVEVASNANPPVAKIIDFKKFKYLEAKKEKEEKKGIKGGDVKEIRLTPFIAANDLNTRVKKIREFLKEGNKVRVRVRFTGRELSKKDFGFRLVDQVVSNLEEVATKETDPKFQGREITLILAPKKVAGKKEETV